MDGPSNLRLKRRITELPPDQLFVERSAKRTYHASVDLRAKGFYVRQKQESENGRPSTAPSVQDGRAIQSAPTQEQRREYHLARASQDTTSRKRKQNEDLATVVESKKKKFDNISTSKADPSHDNNDDSKFPASPAPTKRPGRGSALRPRTDKPKPDPTKTENIAARQQAELNALAQEMHQFALDELAKTPKPQIKTKPKLTPSRSRALHQEHATAAASPHPSVSQNKDDEDGGIDSDGEYVYDTYILAPAPLPTPSATTANDAIETPKTLAIPSNVGYLIISEDDEELWENYMHDLEGSDSEPTDEDDENAEDYYGADYPSDELASDDEHDRGAYRYRARRGSNDEQYNLNDGRDRGGDSSDDDDEPTWSDEEDFRMMNPFARKSQVPKQFAKYLNRDREGEGEGRDVGE